VPEFPELGVPKFSEPTTAVLGHFNGIPQRSPFSVAGVSKPEYLPP